MKKIVKLTVAFFCSLFVSSAFALDYGFLLDNDTTFKTNAEKKMYLLQKDNVSAWIKIPFGKNLNNYFVGEGIYKLKYNADIKKTYNYLDFSLLKFVFYKDLETSAIDGALGRFFLADESGIVFTQTCDGAFVKYSNRLVELSCYAGYTGLLNGNVVSMIDSPNFKGVDSSKFYYLADKNVIAMVTGKAPNLFFDQTLTLQALAAFGLEESPYNRIYATLAMNGAIISNLFYNISGTCSFISTNDKTEISPLVNASLVYYWSCVNVGLNAIWAGKNFTGITSQTALDSESEPEYSDLLKVGLSSSVKPIPNLVLGISSDLAFDGKNNYELKGIQYKVAADYQLFSDVAFGLDWIQYFDINKTDVDYQAFSVKAKVAF